MRGKNLYIKREHKAPRRSKYLVLYTVRESKAFNATVEME